MWKSLAYITLKKIWGGAWTRFAGAPGPNVEPPLQITNVPNTASLSKWTYEGA